MRILASITGHYADGKQHRTLLAWGRGKDIMEARAASSSPKCWRKAIGAKWENTETGIVQSEMEALDMIQMAWGHGWNLAIRKN